MTPSQKQRLEAGTDDVLDVARDAIWVQTEEGPAALTRDRKRLREAYERESGRQPGS